MAVEFVRELERQPITKPCSCGGKRRHKPGCEKYVGKTKTTTTRKTGLPKKRRPLSRNAPRAEAPSPSSGAPREIALQHVREELVDARAYVRALEQMETRLGGQA